MSKISLFCTTKPVNHSEIVIQEWMNNGCHYFAVENQANMSFASEMSFGYPLPPNFQRFT